MKTSRIFLAAPVNQVVAAFCARLCMVGNLVGLETRFAGNLLREFIEFR